MIIREYFGKQYQLVASTDKRVGTVLMAIQRVDKILSKNKRPRINKKRANTVEGKYSNFEEGLAKQINEFKKRKKSEV